MRVFCTVAKNLPERFNEAGDIPTACYVKRNPPPTLKLRGGGHLSEVIILKPGISNQASVQRNAWSTMKVS